MNILINRTDALGDTILTLPMAQKLKESFPESKVYFLIGPNSKDLFKGNPFIDDIYLYDKKESSQEKKEQLKKLFERWQIDHYFYVGGDELPSSIAKKLKVPFRGGIKSRLSTFFTLNKGIRQKRSESKAHEVFYNLKLLEPLGISEEKRMKNIISPLWVTEGEAETAHEKLKNEMAQKGVTLKEKFIVVHPGMTGHTLNWPPAYYVRLVEQFLKEYPGKYTYLFSYTKADRPYIMPIKNKENDEIYFWENTEGLRHYLGVLKKATLFIGPSTGPTHMANALGIPVVGIYSPVQVQSHKRWGPYFKEGKQHVFSPQVDCPQKKMCLGKKCPFFDCMGKVSPKEVGETIIKGNLL